MDQIRLTDAEWQVMEALWELSPQTGRELTERLEASVGWNRSTTLTLLRRLEAKGAVETGYSEGKKIFQPLLRREDAAMKEAEGFLSRVYRGSLSLMVSSFAQRKLLSEADRKELSTLLRELEENDGRLDP
ncbi:MAG: BlaI/MecI/CopY family transcriptional regulator [Oscillospiraceae bacterium]|nr:BlaI/MecI/CopY family transcriptional regulator [Oscillospiraceae bacterium]